MYQKILLSTLGGAIALFLLGGLTFEVILKDYATEMMNSLGSAANPNPSFIVIALAQLSIALLLSILFFKFKINHFSSGLLHGAWITLLIILWYDLWMFATFNFMTTSLFLIDVVSNTLFGAIAGGVIALIQGKVGSRSFTSISQPA